MPMSLQTASLEELKRRERLNSSLWEQRVRLERGEPQFSSEFPALPSKHWQWGCIAEIGWFIGIFPQEWPELGCHSAILTAMVTAAISNPRVVYCGTSIEICRKTLELCGVFYPPFSLPFSQWKTTLHGWGDASELRGRLARPGSFQRFMEWDLRMGWRQRTLPRLQVKVWKNHRLSMGFL